jgi:hypothetical protein
MEESGAEAKTARIAGQQRPRRIVEMVRSCNFRCFLDPHFPPQVIAMVGFGMLHERERPVRHADALAGRPNVERPRN